MCAEEIHCQEKYMIVSSIFGEVRMRGLGLKEGSCTQASRGSTVPRRKVIELDDCIFEDGV
jgi:hypothetical protein